MLLFLGRRGEDVVMDEKIFLYTEFYFLGLLLGIFFFIWVVYFKYFRYLKF